MEDLYLPGRLLSKEEIGSRVIVPDVDFLFFDPRFTTDATFGDEEASHMDRLLLDSDRVLRIDGLPDLKVAFHNLFDTLLTVFGDPHSFSVHLTPYLKFPKGKGSYIITDEDYSEEDRIRKTERRIEEVKEYAYLLEAEDQDEFGLSLVANMALDRHHPSPQQLTKLSALRLRVYLPDGEYESSYYNGGVGPEEQEFSLFYPTYRGPTANQGLQIVTAGMTPEQAAELTARFVLKR